MFNKVLQVRDMKDVNKCTEFSYLAQLCPYIGTTIATGISLENKQTKWNVTKHSICERFWMGLTSLYEGFYERHYSIVCMFVSLWFDFIVYDLEIVWFAVCMRILYAIYVNSTICEYKQSIVLVVQAWFAQNTWGSSHTDREIYQYKLKSVQWKRNWFRLT